MPLFILAERFSKFSPSEFIVYFILHKIMLHIITAIYRKYSTPVGYLLPNRLLLHVKRYLTGKRFVITEAVKLSRQNVISNC